MGGGDSSESFFHFVSQRQILQMRHWSLFALDHILKDVCIANSFVKQIVSLRSKGQERLLPIM